mgnify:CR=1 FL=1
MLVALGGCFAEHSGIINLGLEGIMVMGALGGALMMRYAPDSFGVQEATQQWLDIFEREIITLHLNCDLTFFEISTVIGNSLIDV